MKRDQITGTSGKNRDEVCGDQCGLVTTAVIDQAQTQDLSINARSQAHFSGPGNALSEGRYLIGYLFRRVGHFVAHGLALLACCWFATTACGQTLITNGGFEDTEGTFVPNADTLMSLNSGSSMIPGWTTLNAEIIWARNDNIYAQSPFGSFFLDLTGYHDSPPYGGVAQSISTIPGRRYQLALQLGTNESTPVYSGPVSVAVVVDGITNTTFTFNPGGVSNQWNGFSTHFLAVSNLTTLAIVGTFTAGGAYIGLDEVSVTLLPPELAIETAGSGQVRLSWLSEPGFVLQDSPSLAPASWTNSPSGATNPVVVPAVLPTRFYRLFKP